MFLSDEEIIQVVKESFIDSSFNQAILLDGDWGCGKTYFIKNKLIPKLEKIFCEESTNKRRVIYISLYGVESFKEILDELYINFMASYINSKVDVDSEKIGKGINFITKLVNASLKAVNVDASELPKLSDFNKLKNAVIVFDDIERCNISINELFGFLNNLVEHNDIKVILVANQSEIGKLSLVKELPQKYNVVLNQNLNLLKQSTKSNKEDSKILSVDELQKYTEILFSNDILYEKIKEKLIGITIHYRSDLTIIFDEVVNSSVQNIPTREYISNNKDLIIRLFEEEKYYNLRTLIFAIMSFEKMHIILKEDIVDSKYLNKQFDLILKYCITLSIWIKKGNKPYSWGKDAKYGAIYLKKGSLWGLGDSIKAYKFVDDYLLYRSIEKFEIRSVIDAIIKEQIDMDKMVRNQNSLYLNKLSQWWDLEDEEVVIALEGLLSDLREKRYTIDFFKNIVIMLLQIKNHGFQSISIDDYLKEMIVIAEEFSGEVETNKFELLSDSREFVNSYNEIMKPILDVLNNKKNKLVKDQISYCLKDTETWANNFYEYCAENKSKAIHEYKFFSTINLESLMVVLKSAKTKEIYRFLDAINLIYSFSNLDEFFEQDIQNLTMFMNELNIEVLANGSITKTLALTKVKNRFEEIIELIGRRGRFS
ncbi:P-loop NTPase fold protein [Alkaliphilus transvaalensis]|uniref:P-loop NTPase fold protein n=1 Tax=Alkaliphilus transvaalensis TaxID=114628 RepID=UPI00047C3F3F|nr:P-loop NTPase fold protein [Alkaliphilus transvaalensis]